MSVPPESIQIGKCYLADQRRYPQICRVTAMLSDGRLAYEHRSADPQRRQRWDVGITRLDLIASYISREVPCDWIPAIDEGKP